MDAPLAGPSRVLLVDDHHVVLDALGSAFLATGLFARVVKVIALRQALDTLAADPGFALVVLDLEMPDATGAQAIICLREAHPDIPILVFSAERAVDVVAQAFDAGVRGYVTKDSPLEVVIGAVRVVLAGGCFVPEHMMHWLGLGASPGVGAADLRQGLSLTQRQRQVLDLLLMGVPNKVIGARLGIAEGTVKAHVSTIYRVIGARNRAHAILRARVLGLP